MKRFPSSQPPRVFSQACSQSANVGGLCGGEGLKAKTVKDWQQPRPQGLLLFQNGGRRNPWPRLLKYSKNRGVFCHVTHDETAFSEVGFSVWRPCLSFCNLKLLFKRNECISKCLRDKILTNFWSHFGSLGQGFLRPPF